MKSHSEGEGVRYFVTTRHKALGITCDREGRGRGGLKLSIFPDVINECPLFGGGETGSIFVLR